MMRPLTVKEAAQRLHLSPVTVRHHLRNGTLTGEKLPGGDWLISHAALNWFEDHWPQPGRPRIYEEDE